MKAPQKLLIFLWLCSHNSIPVREVLGSRGFTIDQSCPLCNNHVETIDHLLRECHASVSFWNQLGVPSKAIQSFGLPLLDWLHINSTCGFTLRHLHIPWKTLFIFGLWTLWLNRNSVAFQGRQSNPSIAKICIAKTAEFHFLIQGTDAQNKKIQHPVSWTKLDLGWFKLNTNASVLLSSNCACGGGLIRDSYGSWIRGFSRLIGASNCLLAELWALRDGITMAKNLNIAKLVINVNAAEVISLFSKPSSDNRLTQPIVDDCRNMLQVFQEYHRQHCFRETNKVADLLAKLGCGQSEPSISYVTPPFVVMEVLSFDCNAVPCTDRKSVV